MTERSDELASKYCKDCQQVKPVTEFSRNRAEKDGLSFYCKPCRQLREEASRRARLGPLRNRVRPRDLVVPDAHKWCPDCNQVKPLTEFPRNRREPSGYMSYCKPCFNAATKRSREARHGTGRNYRLKHRYGITEADADRMFAEQGGLCAICREAPAAHVDHDHETGRVRGLLCFNCNGALGQFRDRTDLMIKAVGYLRRGVWGQLIDLPGVQVGFVAGVPDGEPNDGDGLRSA